MLFAKTSVTRIRPWTVGFMVTTVQSLEQPACSCERRLPLGADVQPTGGVHFRIWAPDCKQIDVVLESSAAAGKLGQPVLVPMAGEANGYHSAYVSSATAGTRYRYRLDGTSTLPDPTSRWQPEGPHGPSVVVDPDDYVWHDSGWGGISLPQQIFYEMHIGTFTREGTFAAAARELPTLAAIGITAVEIMPLNEFDGQFGWGYDGVDLFAPSHLYGSPHELRHFVDEAHAHGVAVLLDVVYNHFGPNGNYIPKFAKAFHSRKHGTDWGEAINFDGEQSESVHEFHFDGLRLDAIQAIVDESAEHIVAAITRRVRQAAQGRKTLVVAENEF